MKRLVLSDIIEPSVEGDSTFFARMADAEDFEGLMDPVLGINHFETTGMHQGFYKDHNSSEIFYVFENSSSLQIKNLNGIKTTVAPGSLVWIPKDKKNLHSEEYITEGNKVEGIQLFLNTITDKKEPQLEKVIIDSSKIPVLKSEGVKVRVLCGKTANINTASYIHEDLTILEISLEAGKEFRHILPANWSGTLFALEGHFDVMASQETFELKEGMVISMGYCEYRESILLTGLTPSKILFVTGLPVQEILPEFETFNREPQFVPSGTHRPTNN